MFKKKKKQQPLSKKEIAQQKLEELKKMYFFLKKNKYNNKSQWDKNNLPVLETWKEFFKAFMNYADEEMEKHNKI